MPTEGGEPVGEYHAPPAASNKACVGRRGDHTHLKESDLGMRGSNPSGRLPILGRIPGAAQNKRQGEKLPLGDSLSCKTHPALLRIPLSPFLRGGQDLTYYLRFGRGGRGGGGGGSPLGFSRLASDGAVAT